MVTAEERGGLSYRWWKQPVGREFSYPLKRSDLDAALAEHPLMALREASCGPGHFASGEEFFRGHGMPVPAIDFAKFLSLAVGRWQGVGSGDSKLFPSLTSTLRFYAVPSERRSEIRAVVVRDVLPALLDWLARIESGTNTLRNPQRRLIIAMRGEHIERYEHPLSV